MSQCEVELPELGEGITKATVSFWHFDEGSIVNKDDDLVEVVTEKSTFNVSAPSSGKLVKIFFQEGDEIKIKDKIAIIEAD